MSALRRLWNLPAASQLLYLLLMILAAVAHNGYALGLSAALYLGAYLEEISRAIRGQQP